jgi:hypothetical protein
MQQVPGFAAELLGISQLGLDCGDLVAVLGFVPEQVSAVDQHENSPENRGKKRPAEPPWPDRRKHAPPIIATFA